MSAITTHVLDQSLGKPAINVKLVLELETPEGAWRVVGRGITNEEGRCRSLLPIEQPFQGGRYRLTFNTGVYFARLGVPAFYPEIQVQFEVRDATEPIHIPLLLSPYGYSTCRGL